MTDKPENPSNELLGDLEAPQLTSADAALVRGGNIAASMAAKIPMIDLPKFPTTDPSPTPGGPIDQFQQLLNQVTRD